MPKPEDTQQLSTKEINEAGINYRQPRPRNQTQQPTKPDTAVMVAVILMVGLVCLAIVGAVTYIVITLASH